MQGQPKALIGKVSFGVPNRKASCVPKSSNRILGSDMSLFTISYRPIGFEGVSREAGVMYWTVLFLLQSRVSYFLIDLKEVLRD